MFDEIAQSTTPYNADVQLNKQRILFETVEPQIIAFQEAQLEFEKKISKYITSCFSHRIYNYLIPNDIPITRENVLFSKKLGVRIWSLVDVRAETTKADDKILETAMIRIDQIITLITAETANSGESVRSLIQLFEILDEILVDVLSPEQADMISRNIQHVTLWTEIMEAMELHGWPT